MRRRLPNCERNSARRKLLLSDAQETANNLKEKDSTMKEKFEKLQRDLDVTKMDSRRNVTSLQVTVGK